LEYLRGIPSAATFLEGVGWGIWGCLWVVRRVEILRGVTVVTVEAAFFGDEVAATVREAGRPFGFFK